MQLTQKQIDMFFDYGLVVIKNIFKPNEIEAMGKAFERLYTNSKKLNPGIDYQEYEGTQYVFENGHLHRVVWVGANEKHLLKVAEDERITGPVSQLLGTTEFDQLVNQAHFKVPGDNIEFEWHQDSQHRGYGTSDWKDLNLSGSYVQTALAIDEMTSENGPLKFIPGSQKMGHMALDKTENLESIFNPEDAITLTMQPGDLALFGPYCIHSSTANNSANTRRIFINGYAYPGSNKRQYPGKGSGRRLSI